MKITKTLFINAYRKAFAGKCPVTGGLCLNPMCAFGCIDNLKKHE